jgi:hypothetical protein
VNFTRNAGSPQCKWHSSLACSHVLSWDRV